MSEIVNIYKQYRCNICNKHYASNSSLCNHNKKFHNDNSKRNVSIRKQNVNISECKKNICVYCNKLFACKQSKWKHAKTCKFINKINEQTEIETLKNTINEMRKQVSLILK